MRISSIWKLGNKTKSDTKDSARSLGIGSMIKGMLGGNDEASSEGAQQVLMLSNEMMGGDDMFTEEEKAEQHDAMMEDFRWDVRLKRIEREAPIPIFITQEHLTAEGIKEDEVIEQILSAAYFPEREVHIYVNTYGGDVHTMFAIMDAIQALPNVTKTIGIGKIMSAGGPIMLSGDVRSMTKNSFLMIHDIDGTVGGSPEEMKAEIEFMELLKARFAKFVSSRSKMTEESIMDLMRAKRNHYYSADEALELGLIDEIFSAEHLAEVGQG